MKWEAGFGVLLGLLALTGCEQKFGEDYCVAEKRQVPDREKMVRILVREYESRFNDKSYVQRAPHFSQWMAREAAGPEDTDLAEEAIGRYIDQYPNFVQIVGRWPFVWNEVVHDRYMKSAIKDGYYADIVIMHSHNSDYPTFHEASTRGEAVDADRYGLTNCGNFIKWQQEGG